MASARASGVVGVGAGEGVGVEDALPPHPLNPNARIRVGSKTAAIFIEWCQLHSGAGWTCKRGLRVLSNIAASMAKIEYPTS